MKREVYILASVILLLTGCSSQKKESPSAQPEAGVTAAMRAETPAFAVTEAELESESQSKTAMDIKPAADASDNGQTIVITVGEGRPPSHSHFRNGEHWTEE